MTDYERKLSDYGLTDSQLVEVKSDIDNAITTAVEQERERIAHWFDDLYPMWAEAIRKSIRRPR